MSWTNELYQVYENNVGAEDEKTVLLPIFHSTANAQIEVTLTEEGLFDGAVRIADKGDAVTIIPVTEASGSRSSGISPHPLNDKLLYIGGDYGKFAAGKRADNHLHYQAYLKQLEEWIESEYSHPAIKAVYAYLSRGTLLKDLIEAGVLLVDEETGRLREKEKILGISQEDAFVRFRVEYKDFLNTESRVWKDKSLYESYIAFNSSHTGERQLCYATGKLQPCTYKHPAKIRNAGDKAKLISSNDEGGYSYRGRFLSKEQALSVSFDFSQKFHNALKWLVEKQGVAIGSLTLLMWESNLRPLPDLLSPPEASTQEQEEDPFGAGEWEDLDEPGGGEAQTAFNAEIVPAYRSWLKRSIWGDFKSEGLQSKAMILLLDAATTGRMSISLYEEMAVSELCRNMEQWHWEISWLRFNGKSRRREIHSFSLYEIAECAFGTEQGNFISCKPEVKNDAILRLIPCVLRGQRVPADIVRSLVNRASNPVAYEKRYNWRRVLEVTCGILRRTIIESKRRRKEEEEYAMSLNSQCKDRDYLYGRLLAAADAAESSAYDSGEERVTNARRLFQAFSNRPYQTWGVLYNRLLPYLNKMKPGQKVYYEKLIGGIMEAFNESDYKNNEKLKPEFLLAYHCQLNDIYRKKTKTESEEGNDEHTDE